MNDIFSLNILFGCVSYNKSRSIILKLKIKLAEVIIENTISEILYIEIKFEVLNTEYKEPIYKEI